MTMYTHTSKESNCDHFYEMEEEGLFDGWSEERKKKFLSNYMYTNYEVELEMDVYEDGNTKIVSVDGVKVFHGPKQLSLFE